MYAVSEDMRQAQLRDALLFESVLELLLDLPGHVQVALLVPDLETVGGEHPEWQLKDNRYGWEVVDTIFNFRA